MPCLKSSCPWITFSSIIYVVCVEYDWQRWSSIYHRGANSCSCTVMMRMRMFTHFWSRVWFCHVAGGRRQKQKTKPWPNAGRSLTTHTAALIFSWQYPLLALLVRCPQNKWFEGACVPVLVYSIGIVWNELVCGYASVVHTSNSFHPHTHMHTLSLSLCIIA